MVVINLNIWSLPIRGSTILELSKSRLLSQGGNTESHKSTESLF
jgi:hypothetical protein